MSESDPIRYLPAFVTLPEPEDGYIPASLVTHGPGLVDVRAYPQLAQYTVPRDDAPSEAK